MTPQRWTDEMLAQLATTAAENTAAINRYWDESRERFSKSEERWEELRDEFKEQGIRFQAYQQGIQWVVQLAFTLIASATLTVIITAIVKS